MSSDTATEFSDKAQQVISLRFDPQIDKAAVTKPFRLGLLGGTFDPLHFGHLHIAEKAMEQFSLDGVLFVPTGKPAHKTQVCVLDADKRYAMLCAALADNARFDVTCIEIDRPGTTYTIDTLRALRDRYGEKARFFYIVGADMAADINNWKSSEELAKLITVLVARRKVSEDEECAILQNNHEYDLRFIDSSLIDVSSHELRDWVKTGKSIRHLVPEAVHSYIMEHGLYKS